MTIILTGYLPPIALPCFLTGFSIEDRVVVYTIGKLEAGLTVSPPPRSDADRFTIVSHLLNIVSNTFFKESHSSVLQLYQLHVSLFL